MRKNSKWIFIIFALLSIVFYIFSKILFKCTGIDGQFARISFKLQFIDVIFCILQLLLMSGAIYYAIKNIRALQKSNEIIQKSNVNIKEELEEIKSENWIKHNSDYLEQICLGLLNPSGSDFPENVYGKRMYGRIKNNGFHDGRALLGDMMNFPTLKMESKMKAKDDGMAKYFFDLGPKRYGMTWEELFLIYHEICKAKKYKESGLEPYINSENKCEYHYSNDKITSFEDWKKTLDNKDNNIPVCVDNSKSGNVTSGTCCSVTLTSEVNTESPLFDTSVSPYGLDKGFPSSYGF